MNSRRLGSLRTTREPRGAYFSIVSAPDLKEVEALNRGGLARILCEIAPDEHAELLRRAATS